MILYIVVDRIPVYTQINNPVFLLYHCHRVMLKITISIYNRKLAGQLVDRDRPGSFNQSLMEFGATLCTPQNPSCNICPLKDICKSYQQVQIHSKNNSNSNNNILKKQKSIATLFNSPSSS